MRGHPLTVGLYLLSWLLVLNFAEDVLFGAYPNVLAVRALKHIFGSEEQKKAASGNGVVKPSKQRRASKK